MDSENNIDNYALYIFLFLSTLSVGNDFYHVYLNMLENDFVKKNISKISDYYILMQNVLCNNVKKIKNKIVLEKINNKESNKESNKENNKESNKENKKDNNKESNKENKKKNKLKEEKKELTENENLLIDENKINITKIIQKKEKKSKKNKKDLTIEK